MRVLSFIVAVGAFAGAHESSAVIKFADTWRQYANGSGLTDTWIPRTPDAVKSSFRADETAIIVIDMWNSHWCDVEVLRSDVIGKKLNKTLTPLREMGVTIIHAPSDCADDFYKDHPARKRVTENVGSYANPGTPWSIQNYTMPEVSKADPDAPWVQDPAYPLHIFGGGCDGSRGPTQQPWYEEMALITIDNKTDYISAEPGWWPDRSQEIFNLLSSLQIKNVLFAGVATNLCVLGRPFGIKATRTWAAATTPAPHYSGIEQIALLRDLTDPMYNPVRDAPYVSHEDGLQLQVEFIEKVWAPTVHTDSVFTSFLNWKEGGAANVAEAAKHSSDDE